MIVCQIRRRLPRKVALPFGLTWEDCEQFLDQLGYAARVEVVEAGHGSSPAVVREKATKKYGR